MRLRARGKLPLLVGSALAATSLVAGCGGGGSSADSNTVTIWSSVDPLVKQGLETQLNAELKAEGSNVKVNWQTVQNINQLIITKMQSGGQPDIAFVPQPGVVKQMLNVGKVYPMNDVVDPADLSSLIPGAADFAKEGDDIDGLLVSMNVKGLVFYDKANFSAGGYTAPQSLSELESLVDKIKASGTAPWCFGIESGTATGWAATDWLETLVLKYSGTSVYNDWVDGKVKFASKEIEQAANEFDKLVLTDGNTYGGRSSIATSNFQTVGAPLVADPPKCMLYEQGSFASAFLPKSVQSDIDSNIGVFGVPPAEAGGDNPVEVGGDLMTMLNNNKATEDVVKLLASTKIGEKLVAGDSFISPHKDFPVDLYPNELTKTMAGIAYDASTTAYDASDQMPAAVGSGTFWSEMTAWIAGKEDLDAALKNIDASYPSS